MIKRYQVPEGATILPVVWKIRCKQDFKIRKVRKYKARLKSKSYCRGVGDNSGDLESVRINKYQPCTKHLNNRIHHF